ncbi:MAG: YkgJ family cysteine cluster protein [Candidatus Ranarchaeia archaeon]
MKVKKVQLMTNIRFKCIKCGECCKDPNMLIIVDGADLRNLEKVLGFENLMKNLSFFTIDQKNTDSMKRFIVPSVLTKRGLTFIGLKKSENGECVFLDQENNCKLYKARPRVCRTFPFSFNEKEDGLFWGTVEWDKKCPGFGKGKRMNKKELQEIGSKAMKQVNEYILFVEKWNELVEEGVIEPYVYLLVKSLIDNKIGISSS